MKTILVTDTQTPLGAGLQKLLLQQGCQVVSAPSAPAERTGRKGQSDDTRKKTAAPIAWNRSSPLSAKNVLLNCLQKFDALDAALIVFMPLPPASTFADLKYLDVETVLDVWLKGTILLARDLFSHFISRSQGSLAFVGLSHPKGAAANALDDLCREALLAVFESLAADAKVHGIAVNAFLSRAVDQKAYAEFVIPTFLEKCNKPSGKLFYFQWK
jgi:NAD(P)-dependent dehydrogenase (short-subunit alcohol dehydrogenase family)